MKQSSKTNKIVSLLALVLVLSGCGQQKKATDMSIKNLFANYPLAVLLMVGILVWLFRSYRTSLLLFCCIPFVFVGVIPAMLLSGQNFGFVAIVGILGLVGMMLKNGIVLVDEI